MKKKASLQCAGLSIWDGKVTAWFAHATTVCRQINLLWTRKEILQYWDTFSLRLFFFESFLIVCSDFCIVAKSHDIQITDVTENSARLRWASPEPHNAYVFDITITLAHDHSLVQKQNVTGTEHVVQGLRSGQKYLVVVTGYQKSQPKVTYAGTFSTSKYLLRKTHKLLFFHKKDLKNGEKMHAGDRESVSTNNPALAMLRCVTACLASSGPAAEPSYKILQMCFFGKCEFTLQWC